MDGLHSTNLSQHLFIDVRLSGVVFFVLVLSVCLFILKTVSFVAQADLELEIILHLSPPVLDFPGCTIMPGNVMLEIKYRALSMVGKCSTNLATSPVLTEHFGKASWTVSLLYPTTPPCATCSSWGGGPLNKPLLPKWDSDTFLYPMTLVLAISYQLQRCLQSPTSLDRSLSYAPYWAG